MPKKIDPKVGAADEIGHRQAGLESQGPQVGDLALKLDQAHRLDAQGTGEFDQEARPGRRGAQLPARHALSPGRAHESRELMLSQARAFASGPQSRGIDTGHHRPRTLAARVSGLSGHRRARLQRSGQGGNSSTPTSAQPEYEARPLSAPCHCGTSGTRRTRRSAAPARGGAAPRRTRRVTTPTSRRGCRVLEEVRRRGVGKAVGHVLQPVTRGAARRVGAGRSRR